MSCCRCTMPFGRPVDPDEYIQNAMSSRWVSAGGSRPAGRASHSSADCVATGPDAVAAPFTTTSGLQVRCATRLGIEAVGERGIADGDRGAGIGQIELQQVGRRERVDQQRHEARADGAEHGGRIGGRVVEEQENAVAALQSERQQARAEGHSVGGQLAIGAGAGGADHRGPVAAGDQVVEQDGAGVVAIGDAQSRSRYCRAHRAARRRGSGANRPSCRRLLPFGDQPPLLRRFS